MTCKCHPVIGGGSVKRVICKGCGKEWEKKLAEAWEKKLAEEGMPDKLAKFDRRTIAWDNRDKIRDFFLKLDCYLTHTKGIKPAYRQILELWSGGKDTISDIAKKSNKSVSTVEAVIRKYKAIILAIPE